MLKRLHTDEITSADRNVLGAIFAQIKSPFKLVLPPALNKTSIPKTDTMITLIMQVKKDVVEKKQHDITRREAYLKMFSSNSQILIFPHTSQKSYGKNLRLPAID